jgi:FtsH-binding integral membrane protein
MNVYSVLAGAVLVLHLLWCGWVLFGWLITRGRRLLSGLHIASLCHAIVIELIPRTLCSLTVAEAWLDARAGITPGSGPFLVRILDATIYPNVPEWLVVGAAVVVCVSILGVQARRYLQQRRS